MFRALWSFRSDKHASKATALDSTRTLRTELSQALANHQHENAVRVLECLETREPGIPRWPHKRGDVLMQMCRRDEAFSAYAVAVRLYTHTGKDNLAAAMAKTASIAFPAGT